MKFDDVKKVEEGVMSNLFGRGAAAGVKSSVGKQSGQTQEHILAQDIFLQDFTSDALGAIQTAVDAGLIVKDGQVVDQQKCQNLLQDKDQHQRHLQKQRLPDHKVTAVKRHKRQFKQQTITSKASLSKCLRYKTQSKKWSYLKN